MLVPPGISARLSIRPLISADLFDTATPGAQPTGPLDHHLLQLAVGKTADEKWIVFEGASLVIEAMNDGLSKANPETFGALAREWIKVAPSGTARQYQVIASMPPNQGKDDSLRIWHHIAEIGVRTQRWRFSGRPIYNWINPRDFAVMDEADSDAQRTVGDRTASPVMELEGEASKMQPGTPGSRGSMDLLSQFEAEAFFDRDNADADDLTVRLAPVPARTILRTFFWESPAATYFRHGFSFLSRYKGAMDRGVRVAHDCLATRQQGHTSDFERWTKRVAVLADPGRIELTRPQLRAFVPLASKPASGSEPRRLGESPPLACIIEEKPFALGGLAERIVGEIKTGIAYGFGAQDSTVSPQDLGKEIGVDPRLSTRALVRDALGFTLELEGPVGLHFDRTSISAPSWSNSQYLLSPVDLGANHAVIGEESFLGISLQRVLDPRWVAGRLEKTHDHRKPESFSVESYQAWWTSYEQPGFIRLGPEGGILR